MHHSVLTPAYQRAGGPGLLVIDPRACFTQRYSTLQQLLACMQQQGNSDHTTGGISARGTAAVAREDLELTARPAGTAWLVKSRKVECWGAGCW